MPKTAQTTSRVLVGDAACVLPTLPSESVHCIVTSPPYYTLRDYGVTSQIGHETNVDAYITRLVIIFQEARRILRTNGTFWLNVGDTFAKSHSPGVKPKDLLGIPWMLAFALRKDGWHLRSDVIWHKPNGMPSSVKDRPTVSHEYLFLLSKSPTYYYDYMAIAEPAIYADQHARKATSWGMNRKHPNKSNVEKYAFKGENHTTLPGGLKNKRSVWTIPTKPFRGTHCAVFPTALVEPCILAGCPEGGVVLDPFSGSGTTGVVAIGTGRNYIGIEINPEFAALSEARIAEESPRYTPQNKRIPNENHNT